MIDDYLRQIRGEEEKNKNFLHITANESQMSETARMFLASKLSERYYAGAGTDDIVDFGFFTMLGLKGVASVVGEAEEAAKQMLSASVVNLSCLSGIHAMMCAIFAATEPGDTVMSLHPENGGHFATKGIIERIGRKHIYAYFDNKKVDFDCEKTAKAFHASHAKTLYIDTMYCISPYDLKSLSRALGKQAIITYDASHTMGLIMGQTFQAPLREGADIICANTHKTLPGPHKGMIAFKDKTFGDKANIIVKGSLSSCHTQQLIALAITILELKAFGREYAQQTISNANAVGQAFTDLNYDVQTTKAGRYSENHQVHVFIDNKGERLNLYKKLIENNISTNFVNQGKGRLYIRLGTQELTRRGMKEVEMKKIAAFINRAFKGENIKQKVIEFNKQFSNILYSFDCLT